MLYCNNVLQPCVACGRLTTDQKSRFCLEHQLSLSKHNLPKPPPKTIVSHIKEDTEEYVTVVLGLDQEEETQLFITEEME